MSTRTHAFRNTVFSSLGIYTEYLLGMLAAIMIARHLGPESYGVYGLFMWFVAVGMAITNSGVTNGVIKFVAEARGLDRSDLIRPLLAYLRRVQQWHLLVALGVGVAAFLVAGDRLDGRINHVELGLLVAAVGMRASYMFNIAVAKGFEAFDATAKVALVAAPLNLAMVGAAMLLNGSILLFLVVYAISSAVFLLASQLQVRRLLAPLAKRSVLHDELMARVRRHLRIVSATVVISFMIASDIEILFLSIYDSASSAGYFKVAYQLATGITLLVPGVFGALLLPMMARALSQGREVAGRRFALATSYLVLLTVPVATFGICFAGPAIELLYGKSYATAAPVFALIILSSGIATATQGAISLLVSADRQHIILALTIVFGVLKIALDIVLISQFGLRGAVAAILTETLLSSAAFLTIAMRVGGTPLQWERLLRTVLAGSGAALVALPVLGLQLMPIWTVLIGVIVVSVVYLLLTLVLECWTSDDVEQLRDLHQRFAKGRPLLLGRLLGWAEARAERRS